MSGQRVLSVVLPLLLLVVAGSAAVLSFAALRDLAVVCGFSPRLAWLLPVVVDAGAAAGSLVWLGGTTGAAARGFARGLALALLGLSVAANALGHGLAAFGLAAPWWVVVTVSAVAPAVLGAVVHLAVLATRPPDRPAELDGAAAAGAPVVPVEVGAGVPVASGWAESAGSGPGSVVGSVDGDGGPVRAAELIEAGMGRRRLARELDISEYEARQLLTQARPVTSSNGTSAGGRS